MTKQWLSALPLPTRKGYRITAGQVFRRTERDTGLSAHRQVFTKAPTLVSVQWRLSEAQYATFKQWYQTIQMGAEFFTITLLSGLGLQPCVAQFTEQPKTKRRGNAFDVSASLEVLHWPVVGADVVALSTDENLEDLRDAFRGFHTFIQQTLKEMI